MKVGMTSFQKKKIVSDFRVFQREGCGNDRKEAEMIRDRAAVIAKPQKRQSPE
jgi:hypothetical protein